MLYQTEVVPEFTSIHIAPWPAKTAAGHSFRSSQAQSEGCSACWVPRLWNNFVYRLGELYNVSQLTATTGPKDATDKTVDNSALRPAITNLYVSRWAENHLDSLLWPLNGRNSCPLSDGNSLKDLFAAQRIPRPATPTDSPVSDIGVWLGAQSRRSSP